MNILFIGSVQLSAKLLKKLILLKANIIGVITKKHSDFNSDFFDLSPIAESSSIPFKYVQDINTKSNIEWIRELNPDIIFCFGWSNLIKDEILEIPSKGVLGFHPTALPFNRGRHPLIWSLVLGLEETASTFFFMDKNADSGDILSQKTITIDSEDDASILYKKVVLNAEIQLDEFLPRLASNNYTVKKQNNKNSNYWRRRSNKDGEIDWRMSSFSIYNLIRGLSKPYIGAHFLLNNEKIIVWKSKIINNSVKNIEPGKILRIKESSFIVKTGDTALEILEMDHKLNLNVGDYL